ncbi:hypothetical protein CJD44_13740 [Streptomyces sp. alain-838]|nr:hypothetical protein CJD44_13740 [Streptomyces sp. alain-838]
MLPLNEVAFVLTGGNTNDCTQFTAVMEAIRVPRIGRGRPRVRPDHFLGDKGSTSKAIRTWLRHRGITHHPGTGRPGPQPGPGAAALEDARRSSTARSTSRQRRGTVLQPLEAVAKHSDPL